MTDTGTLPSDSDLIAFIRERQPCTVGDLAQSFHAERDAMRDQLRRLKKDGKLKSESMKRWDTTTHAYRYFSEWSVA